MRVFLVKIFVKERRNKNIIVSGILKNAMNIDHYFTLIILYSGDLNGPISVISKTSFFGKGFKSDSTTDREIENELNLVSLDI